MNRRSRHLVVLMVAVVTAAIASFAIYRTLLLRPDAAERAPLFVVVAARSMAIGTELTERDVKRLAWPSGNAVPGAISDVKNVAGRGLLTAVLENEPLTVNKLAPVGTAGLPPAIPRGMRAMSVKVNDVIGVAGFVVPGTRVDVVVTIRRQTDSMTRTAAGNVQVLAAGTRQDQGKPENRRQDRERFDGRDADRVAGGCGAHRARAVRGRDHADAAQPARQRDDDHDGHQHGFAPRRE